MTTDDKEMWRINIENDTDMVCSMYGSETAESVFRRHGATALLRGTWVKGARVA